jgi:predicted Rossmann fold nucleotide-binding protein DprA/Smf involved in DNA uptake
MDQGINNMPTDSDTAFGEMTDTELDTLARKGTVRQKKKAREIIEYRKAIQKLKEEKAKQIPITEFVTKTPAKTRVKRFLSDHKRITFTISKISHDTSTSKGTTSKYLTELLKQKRIKRVSRGHYVWKIKHKRKAKRRKGKR